MEQRLPCRPGGVCGDVARERVGDVVVLEAGAEACLGRHKAQAMRDRGKVEPARSPQIVRISKPAAVREQIAHRDLARDVRVRELDSRLVFGHRIVERYAPRIGEHRHEHRGEGLGRGHITEARVDGHRIGLAELADTVAFDEEDGVVLDDHDRQAGDPPIGHRLGDVGVKAVEWGVRGGPLLGAGGAKAETSKEEEGA